jgi:ABC-type branched-subunit amino acid transport system ATPase component
MRKTTAARVDRVIAILPQSPDAPEGLAGTLSGAQRQRAWIALSLTPETFRAVLGVEADVITDPRRG